MVHPHPFSSDSFIMGHHPPTFGTTDDGVTHEIAQGEGGEQGARVAVSGNPEGG